MNSGTLRSVTIKEEPSDHVYLLEEYLHAQETRDPLELDDLRRDSDFPNTSSSLLKPIIKNEVDGKNKKNSMSTLPLDSGGQEPNFSDAQFLKKEPRTPDSFDQNIKEEANVTKENERRMESFSSSGEKKSPVKPYVKIESDDLGTWKVEPINSNSREIECKDPRKTADQRAMTVTGQVLSVVKKHPEDHHQAFIKTVAESSNRPLFYPEVQSYSCNDCEMSFAEKSAIEEHVLTHSGETPHKCTFCGIAFTDEAAMNRHMSIHTGEKPHECRVCGKTFTQKSARKIHMLIHTGEKPHVCSVCQKSFTHKSTLKYHLSMHSGEKPYECSICKKAFTGKLILEKHMLIHSGVKPHKCNFCRKAFTVRSVMMNHMLMHTGEKPHECSVCRMTFARESNVKKHMLIHSSEKPHECSVCRKTFARKSNIIIIIQQRRLKQKLASSNTVSV